MLASEVEAWEFVAARSRAFRRKLRMMFLSIVSITTRRNATHAVQRSQTQSRRNATHAVQRSQTQSTASTRRKTARAPNTRPPAVGNLPCRFDDTPHRPSVPTCVRLLSWCRVHELEPVQLSTSALQNVLPEHQGVDAYNNWQQAAQLKRVSCWKLGRALWAGRPAVFSYGNALRAISAWRTQHAKSRDRCPPLRVLSSFLERTVVPTMLASPSG
jgi:hypothetical protein